MAPMVQKRVRCARKPISRPAPSEISSGACSEPGPVSLKKIGPSLLKTGWKMSSSSRPTMISGHDPAHRRVGLLAATQAVAGLEELHADGDAHRQAGQAEDGVQVAAGQAQERAPGAAQEGQRADHGEHAQHEAHDGRRAGARPELAESERRDHGAEHETDDLRADVLHDGGAVQAQRAGDVALEAGHADAHVGRDCPASAAAAPGRR